MFSSVVHTTKFILCAAAPHSTSIMSFIHNSMAAALCIQYLQHTMPTAHAQFTHPTASFAATAYTNCVNGVQRIRNSPFFLPHLSPFAQSHDVAALSIGNHAVEEESSTSVEECTISSTKVDNVSLPSFNVNGEPQLLLPPFIIMVEERGVAIDKLDEKCEELRIQCTPATTLQIREAKSQRLLGAEVTSLALMFKSDAERLCKQLFHKHPSTQMECNMSSGIFVYHNCFGKERGTLYPTLYTEENACCIKCSACQGMLSTKSFVGHTHRSEEMSVRHWGFDSENWRSYLTLDKQKYFYLDDATMAAIRQMYDTVKAMFDHKFKSHVTTEKLQSCIPPPPAHLNMGSVQQSSLDLSTSSLVLANPERVIPKPDDTQYNDKHVPNISLEVVKNLLKRSSSAFHPFANETILKPKLEGDLENLDKETIVTAATSLEPEYTDECELVQDLIKDEGSQVCLERFRLVKKKYLTTIKTLRDALSKANEQNLRNNMEWKRKFDNLKQKKRTLKRALTDYPEPHRKQFIQLRYQFELEQERNRELQNGIDLLQHASGRENELRLSLEEKSKETSLAQLEVHELREKLRRLKHLQTIASSNNNGADSSSCSAPLLDTNTTTTTRANSTNSSTSCMAESFVQSPQQDFSIDLDDERNALGPPQIERVLL